MVTAYGREDVMRLAEQAGVNGFLIKPVSPSTLLDTILVVLGRGRILGSDEKRFASKPDLAISAGGILAGQREGWRRQLSEALCVLGTMAFGAGIWLVAQVYNIDEQFPAGFLIWGLGALAMAWAIQSVPQAIIATILL